VSRLPLGRAHHVVSALVRELRARTTRATLTPTGGLRRGAPDIGRLSILAVHEDDHPGAFLAACCELPSVVRVVTRSDAAVSIDTGHGVVTVHAAAEVHAGAALLCLTGPTRHLEALGALAAARGLHLADGRLLDQHGVAVHTPTEEAVYARLGLHFIPPELREEPDALTAAQDAGFPPLLTTLHVRGDLHMHSNWSDGRDSLADMVAASAALGYEYMAVTDHSPSAGSSRQLSASDVPRQRAEVAALRRAYPRLAILHGVEVDILHDGSLDFDDDILRGFDIVLASLHDGAGQSGEALTARYLRAIAHPLVNVITHPANRSPLVRPGYDVDFERIFAAARDTGTALEIDGAPGHLDMDGALARRAVAAGVPIVVSSDSHRSSALARQMRFGVATARRGWVEPRHVLNTRSRDQVLAFIAAKRQRAA